jgi:hypothetical protein
MRALRINFGSDILRAKMRRRVNFQSQPTQNVLSLMPIGTICNYSNTIVVTCSYYSELLSLSAMQLDRATDGDAFFGIRSCFLESTPLQTSVSVKCKLIVLDICRIL